MLVLLSNPDIIAKRNYVCEHILTQETTILKRLALCVNFCSKYSATIMIKIEFNFI